MRKRFILKGELDESKLRRILDPILLGIDRTTHRVKYRTSKGVVEYVSIPLGSSLGRYSDLGISGTLRKITLWSRDSTDELEQMLRSNGVEMVEVIKEGPKTLELKK